MNQKNTGIFVEAWSPTYPNYPYDSDGRFDDHEEAIQFIAQWRWRFPINYWMIINDSGRRYRAGTGLSLDILGRGDYLAEVSTPLKDIPGMVDIP